MEPFIPKNTKFGPERIIQGKIISKLRGRGWFCKETHGNEFQCGFPDVFACHLRYGSRWIEVKQPVKGKLEESQTETFTELSKKKVGVWILTGESDYELNKLMLPDNWYTLLDTMKHVTRDRVRKSDPWKRQTRISSSGPERDIQDALKSELAQNDWYTMETHGNIYQYGFPDLYACHREYGARWIEVKNPRGYVFTPSQLETFPLMQAHGCGVWVLTGANELGKLFKAPNWFQYLDVWKPNNGHL